MGWSGGDEIVDPVVDEMINWIDQGKLHPNVAQDILAILVRACQGRDWDTEEESLGIYKGHDWVVAAFARCEIYVRCEATAILESWDRRSSTPKPVEVECGLPRDHTVDHFDEEENLEWPISSRL